MLMSQADQTLIILSPGFARDEADSTCLPAQQILIKALNKNFGNLKIVIIAFHYPFSSDPYKWNGNQVIPLNGENKPGIHRFLLAKRAWQELKKIKKGNNIIGLFSFWCTECALVGRYFGTTHGIKHYTWILGQDARKSNPFVKWIRPQADSLVAMSAFLAEEFYRNHRIRPAHILPNGIDTSLYPSKALERDIDVLGAGSLIPLKQYDLFIGIVKELSHQFPGINAMISGKGPEAEKLQQMVDDLSLQHNLLLAGEKAHTELLQLMCRAKVFLHTSSYEGFSSVCLEALYAGAHVISFCNPVAGWIRNWHIVDNKEEMLELAAEILKDPQMVYQPLLLYSVNDNAKKLMELFYRNDNKTTTNGKETTKPLC